MEYLVNTSSQLAMAVKSRRKVSGLTQAAAAARVGLLPKTVSAMENHPEKTTVESLFRLLAALELELVLKPKAVPLKTPSGERATARRAVRFDRNWHLAAK
jgi:HTH-type transcriptional regulator / antitoxin HipB